MIFSDFHFLSEALGVQTAVYVLMPEEKVLRQSRQPVPVLYLLHGLSDDHTIWLRRTCIEQFAARYRVAVVMPAVNRSFYMDMAYGPKYETFVARELPHLIETYFPVGKKREHRFVAGLSMGGFGAMKLGLSHPNRYAAVACLSGVLDMERRYDRKVLPGQPADMLYVFGSRENMLRSNGNLFRLAQKMCRTPDKTPKIYQACGTEDSLFPDNEAFFARFGEALSVEYHTEPGAHTWEFWNRHIERVLAWLPLEKAANG